MSNVNLNSNNIDSNNTGISFDDFRKKIEARVNQISAPAIQQSSDGLSHSSSHLENNKTEYDAGLNQIYQYNVNTACLPILAGDQAVKDRLLLNLVIALSDNQGRISDTDKSKIAALAIRSNIDLTTPAFRIDDLLLADEITKIELEIEATKQLMPKLADMISTLKKDNVDLGPFFFDKNKEIALPLSNHLILKILTNYYTLSTDYLTKNHLEHFSKNIGMLLNDIPSNRRCIHDFHKFLARVDPYVLEIDLETEKDQIELLKIIADTDDPQNVMHQVGKMLSRHYESNTNLDVNETLGIYYQMARKLIEKTPKAFLSIEALAYLPLDLMQRVADAGSKEALICLTILKHNPQFKEASSWERAQFLMTETNDNRYPKEEELQLELMELGDLRAWDSNSKYKNDKTVAMHAIDHNPSIVDWMDDHLKTDPDILELLWEKFQQGNSEVWADLPEEYKTVENALKRLKAADYANISYEGFNPTLKQDLQKDNRFHQLIEEQFRQGVCHQYYPLLTTAQQANHELLKEAITANPKIYEELMKREYKLKKKHAKGEMPTREHCPFVGDPELVRIYLTAFPWKADQVLIQLGNPPWMRAAIRFTAMVLLNEESFAFDKDIDENTKRYYMTAIKLTMNEQMELAAKTEGYGKSVINPKDVTWASQLLYTLGEHL